MPVTVSYDLTHATRIGTKLSLKKPTNIQSSEKKLRNFIDAAIAAA